MELEEIQKEIEIRMNEVVTVFTNIKKLTNDGREYERQLKNAKNNVRDFECQIHLIQRDLESHQKRAESVVKELSSFFDKKTQAIKSAGSPKLGRKVNTDGEAEDKDQPG